MKKKLGFLESIQEKINNNFSLASIVASGPVAVGVYNLSYKVKGNGYTMIGGILTVIVDDQKFSQIYVYDADDNL